MVGAPPPDPDVQVTDVRALRGLVHPLRNRTLGLLRLEGHGTGRERWWRARHRMTSWSAEAASS